MTTPLPPATLTAEDPVYCGPQGYEYAYVAPPQGRIASFLSRLPAWTSPAGVAALIGGGVAYTLLMHPTSSDASSSPTCVVKLFTGFDCPGCGGTRAAWFMLHGDIPAAARHHAPLVFATPFLAYLFIRWALGTVTEKVKLPRLVISNRALVGFLVAWLVFSVVRNLPWAPFTWLFV